MSFDDFEDASVRTSVINIECIDGVRRRFIKYQTGYVVCDHCNQPAINFNTCHKHICKLPEQKLCSGYGVFPGGNICPGCPDCKDKKWTVKLPKD
jgi:hypothetical protein